jgi:multiple sugar transport system substrate-binding protein
MKKILLFAVAIIIGLIVGACGNKDATAPNVIKFWHFWSEPNQKQVLLELIKKFEQENSCKVELTELSWNDGKTKLIAAFNSGVAPDVLELGSDWIAQFSSTNVLAQIGSDSIDFNKFLEYSLSPAQWKDSYYAVPWIVDTRLLFVNKALMQSAGLGDNIPADYNTLIEYSDKINNPDRGIYGFGANGSDPHRLYKKILPMFWTYGGEILDDAGNPVLNSSKNTMALEKYLELSRLGIIETQRQLDAYFSQGKIGFVFSGEWLLEKIKRENSTLNFDVALVPTTNSDDANKKNGGISFLGCEYLAMSQQSDKKELSMKLIRFLSNGENALELAKKFAEAGFPADRAFFNSEYLLKDAKKSVFSHQLKNAKATPVHPRWLDIEAILENAVTRALYGEISADGALNEAQIEVLKILSEKE